MAAGELLELERLAQVVAAVELPNALTISITLTGVGLAILAAIWMRKR